MTNRKRLKMKMEKLWLYHLTVKAEFLSMLEWYESLKKGD